MENKETNQGEKVLTSRETEIIKQIANGKTNKEISLDLSLSTSTVKNHISNIFIKLKISNRAQATAFAINAGLLEKNPDPTLVKQGVQKQV